MIAKSVGNLYVGGHPLPVSEIKLNSVLRELNHKIIECRWDFDKKGWAFMRQRTDKSFPNGYKTFMGMYKKAGQNWNFHFIATLNPRADYKVKFPHISQLFWHKSPC